MPDLSEIRLRLDQMTERIISRLKDRSRFPQNPTVYLPDGVAVEGHDGVSFLEFALAGLESFHASLGRYEYPDQYQLFTGGLPGSSARRRVGEPDLPRLAISIRDDLLAFHQGLVKDLCPPGDAPDTYGETVYVDADLLMILHERINIGRYVAEAKRIADPTLAAVLDAPDLLTQRLTDAIREAALVARVREVARRYEVPQDLAESVFRWIIQETLVVEVAYLRKLAGVDH